MSNRYGGLARAYPSGLVHAQRREDSRSSVVMVEKCYRNSTKSSCSDEVCMEDHSQYIIKTCVLRLFEDDDDDDLFTMTYRCSMVHGGSSYRDQDHRQRGGFQSYVSFNRAMSELDASSTGSWTPSPPVTPPGQQLTLDQMYHASPTLHYDTKNGHVAGKSSLNPNAKEFYPSRRPAAEELVVGSTAAAAFAGRNLAVAAREYTPRHCATDCSSLVVGFNPNSKEYVPSRRTLEGP